MDIETKTVSLEALSVTIRALHVNGKQMTLAVFRQLPMRFEGFPSTYDAWGIVQYEIRSTTEWLVFSAGGVLCRRSLSSNRTIEYARAEVNWHRNELKAIKARQKRGTIYVSDEAAINYLTPRLKYFENLYEDTRLYDAEFFNSLPQLFIDV